MTSAGPVDSAAKTAVEFLSKPCWEILHPKNTACPHHLATSFVDVFLRGVKLYGPLYLALALVKKRKYDFQSLKPTLQAIVRTSTFVCFHVLDVPVSVISAVDHPHFKPVIVSALFPPLIIMSNFVSDGLWPLPLALLGPGSLVITCLSYHIMKTHNRFMYFLAGAVPGFLAVLVERKERRREITIFMISVLLEQFWRMAVARKLVSPIKYGEVILFSLVMGVMNYLYTFEKECMGNSETAMAMIVGDKDKPDRVEATLQRYLGFRSKGSDFAHIATGALKGFLIGFGIRAGQWLLGFVLRGGKASSKGSPAFSELLQQAARIGSFLALLVGGTRAVQFATKLMNLNKRAAAFISGAVAGASGALYPSIEISLYIIAKACEAVTNVGNKYKVIPWPLSSRHFEKFFFSFEIGMGFYGVCFENPTMRRSFWNFLLGISGGRLDLLPQFTRMASQQLGYPLGPPGH